MVAMAVVTTPGNDCSLWLHSNSMCCSFNIIWREGGIHYFEINQSDQTANWRYHTLSYFAMISMFSSIVMIVACPKRWCKDGDVNIIALTRFVDMPQTQAEKYRLIGSATGTKNPQGWVGGCTSGPTIELENIGVLWPYVAPKLHLWCHIGIAAGMRS